MRKSVGLSVTTKDILEYLELITSELTDAYNTAPDTPETSDTLYYIDTARELVDELTTRLEDPQEEPVPHEDLRKEKEFSLTDDEAMVIMNVAQKETERRFEDSKEAN